jgi:hypothetical protein
LNRIFSELQANDAVQRKWLAVSRSRHNANAMNASNAAAAAQNEADTAATIQTEINAGM